VRVHSLTLSYTSGSMRCDSQASSWLAPLQPLCLGREPKAKVAIIFVATLTWPSVGGEAQHLEKLGIWSPPGLPNV